MEKAYIFIKKYPVDAGLILLFLLCAFLFAESPKAETGNRGTGVSAQRQKAETGNRRIGESEQRLNTNAVSPTRRFPDSPIPPYSPTRSYKNLDARNIFDPDGNYEKSKGLKVIPENPYNLIAVLEGKEKRAIFMEYTGSAMSFKAGDKMIDGAVVKSIDKLSVTVKKGRELKVYRIFEIKNNKEKDKK